MNCEAERLHVSEQGRVGGIILDEMSIQQDIQINKNGEVVELVGFEDIGEEGNTCNILRKGKREKELGTHVLQFLFLGNTGFRFPFAHFVTTNIQAYDIYSLFWDAVDYLYLVGFTVAYTCTDGAQSNRTFININLGKEPSTMMTVSPCNPNKSVIFMMDISHVIKKNTEQCNEKWHIEVQHKKSYTAKSRSYTMADVGKCIPVGSAKRAPAT